MINNVIEDTSWFITNIENIIIQDALNKVKLADEGLVVNNNLCRTTNANLVYNCLMRFSMFSDAQQKNLCNIYKELLLL